MGVLTLIKNQKNLVHLGFDIGLLLKGIGALAEILGGLSLLFFTPDRLNNLIVLITKGELSEDPHDFWVNYLVTFGHSFSVKTWQFVLFYMLSHGIIKMIVVLLLRQEKLWAFPLSVAVFVFFIVYQTIHYTHSHSVFLLLLTVLDIVMIVFTILEYRRIQKKSAHNTGS